MTAEKEEAIIRVTFETDEKTFLNLIGRTLADLNALCELVVSLSNPKYSRRDIPLNSWRVRRSSRLEGPDQLSVRTIRLSSPLVMEIIVPAAIAATAAWPLVQALEKLSLLWIERRTRRLQQARESVGLERDEIARERERVALAKETAELDTLIRERRAEEAFSQATHRLLEDLPLVSVTPRLPLPPPPKLDGRGSLDSDSEPSGE